MKAVPRLGVQTPTSDHRCVVLVPGLSTWSLWWTQWHRDWLFFQYVPHSPVSIIPPLLYTLCEYYCYQKDKGKESRNLKQSNARLNIGEHWMEKYFHVVLFR